MRQRENVASQRQKGGPEGDSMRGPELIAREGTATGGDMVKEREHRESCEREREREGRKIGSKWKGRREERQREAEQRGLEALFVGTVSQKSSSSSPFDLSLSGPASLYGAETQVSAAHTHTHTHTEFLMSNSSSLVFFSPDMFMLRSPHKHLVNESQAIISLLDLLH